jgi:hypothetical protein
VSMIHFAGCPFVSRMRSSLARITECFLRNSIKAVRSTSESCKDSRYEVQNPSSWFRIVLRVCPVL